MTLKLMRWVMANWQRVDFFNTYLAGHLVPRIEMDLLPGLFCAAHFAIVAEKATGDDRRLCGCRPGGSTILADSGSSGAAITTRVDPINF